MLEVDCREVEARGDDGIVASIESHVTNKHMHCSCVTEGEKLVLFTRNSHLCASISFCFINILVVTGKKEKKE